MADAILNDYASQLRRPQKGTAETSIFNGNLTTSFQDSNTVEVRGHPKILVRWAWTKASGTTLRFRIATSNDDSTYSEVDVWETPSGGESTVYPHQGKIVAADHTDLGGGTYGGVFEVLTGSVRFFKIKAKSDNASGSLVLAVLGGS